MIAARVPQVGPGVPSPQALEQEVLDNVRHQRLGEGTVEDLALPEEFLRRVADRVIRTSYEERYRIVVPDGATVQPVGVAVRGKFVVLVSAVAILFAAAVVLVIVRGRK